MKVTTVMEFIEPIKGFHSMEAVFDQLEKSSTSGAPVVDEMGYCIGVLTMTDIEKYRLTKDRFANQDLSSLDAVFEVDEFGMRRIHLESFDRVGRHMTCPVVIVDEDSTVGEARQLLSDNQSIHHLVVVDSDNRPLGILDGRMLDPPIRDAESQVIPFVEAKKSREPANSLVAYPSEKVTTG